MAYSGKITLNNIYEVWSYIIRFITSDSTVDGKDWSINVYKDYNNSNFISAREFEGTLTSITLDAWIDLPTISVYDYSFGTKIIGEVVGTGDGITTSFNYTVANTPIGNYSVVINYTISGSNYTAFDDGNGNITGTSVSGTINYSTGVLSLTFNTAPDNGTNITIDYMHNNLAEGTDYQLDIQLGKVMFLSTGSVIAGSNVDYFYRWKPMIYALTNTGLSGTDNIRFLLKPLFEKDETQGWIIGQIYNYYDNSSNTFVDIVGYTGIAFWNNSIDLWIFSNKQRVIVVVKSGVYYSSFYAGYVNRIHLPDEIPDPILFIGSHYCKDDKSSLVAYNDETGNTFMFIGCRYVAYRDFSTGFVFKEQGRSGNTLSQHWFQPHFKNNIYSSMISVSYPTWATKRFFPIYFCHFNDIFLGLLDGVFLFLDSDSTSESTFTDSSGISYIIFPDVFRTSNSYWYAIKEV